MVRDMGVSSFATWFPIRVYGRGREVRVQWFRRDAGLCFDDRFFHDTVSRAAKRPFNLAFYRDTGVDVLHEAAAEMPGLRPNGLLFHLSRCGSTLVSNAFAARFDVLVLAEPGPLNDVLVMPGLDDEERLALLRSVVSVLARPQRADQRACVIKLDAWHVRSFAPLEAAFPRVPWFVLHRDPREILVSHLCTPSLMMSTVNAPATLGLSLVEAAQVPRDVHCVRVLSELMRAVHERAPEPDRLVDYAELPQAIWERIGPGFDLPFTPNAVARLHAGASAHAKDPRRPFTPDSDEKRAAAAALPSEIVSPLLTAYAWFKRPITQ
ncbi:MAG TPA: hypothetical protein VMF11_01925 [Candidatus Baltobacteraceae bacterium]|nr:hypothetical protein [Candidatus Baltobacteraceae bacterium]